MRRIERTARHHHDALKSIGARNDAVRVPTTLRARASRTTRRTTGWREDSARTPTRAATTRGAS